MLNSFLKGNISNANKKQKNKGELGGRSFTIAVCALSRAVETLSQVSGRGVIYRYKCL